MSEIEESTIQAIAYFDERNLVAHNKQKIREYLNSKSINKSKIDNVDCEINSNDYFPELDFNSLRIMAACFVTLLFICKEPIHYVGIFSLFLNLTFAIASLYFCYRCSGIEKNAVTTQGPGIIHLPTDRNEALRPPEYTAYPSEMPPQYTTSLPDATEEHMPPQYTASPSYTAGAEMPPQYNASLSDVTEEHMPPQYTASPSYTAGAEMPPQYNASLSDVTEEHMPPQYTASPSYTAGAEMPPQYNASLPDATEEHMPPQDTASPSYTAGAEMPPQYNASLPDATEEHMPPQDTASPSYTAGKEIPPQYNASPPDADATKELCLHQLPNERE
ncbi:Hypothetical predicted protein [Octopus vulgaris]|uniref:Uncharacterized protein n=1 Tax=Octopus vulgaris TaxID=6645 RepID=A0AA36B9K0_OCTVU|nr:Hypothetical predicted protein [Octopus vulgaris]